MDMLTADGLALRAGVPLERVERLTELGVLTPGDGDHPFAPSDVQRVRLVEAMERSGISLEDLGKAITDGHMSLGWVEFAFAEPVGLSTTTYEEMCRRLGVSFDLIRGLHESVGFPQPKPEDLVREDDLQLVSELMVVFNFGLSERAVTNAVRVYGENLRRIAQAETGFFRTYILDPMLAAGMPARQVQEISSQSGGVLQPLVRRMILWLYQRHQETAIIQNLIEQTDAALEEAGVARRRAGPPPAIAFLDLTGYTRLTEEQGDEAAAELASTLASFVTSSTRPYGGVPIKWLGDGVMFYFPDPGEGVVSALEMVEQVPGLGLPPAHVGVHAGPVVLRDGDYFGRTVNIAARIAARAGPGEVLVSQDLLAVASPEGVRFEQIGPVDLKGVTHPVTLHRAQRSD